MVVDTAWLSTSAMLIPFERMRVGINSDSASQTHTPGPTAKNAMNTNSVMATIQPLRGRGTGVMSAFSIFSGAVRAASRSPNGLEKNATTLFAGTQLSRVDLDWLCGRIVGAHHLACRPEVSVRINHDQRSWTSVLCSAELVLAQQFRGQCLRCRASVRPSGLTRPSTGQQSCASTRCRFGSEE